MKTKKRIFVIIPCLNEEKGVGKVIKNVPIERLKKMGYKTEVIVVDNNSIDKTSRVAQKHGAKVFFEQKKGKGNALKKGFYCLPKVYDFVVIIDGDNTYSADEIPRLIEPLENNFADMIVGSRLAGKTKKNSLTAEKRLANWFYTFWVRHFYRVNTTDVLSGFIAFKKNVINDVLPYIESGGFAIEMELNCKISKLGYTIFAVPITYDVREGDSKIEKIRDAISIFIVFFKYFFWRPEKET